MADLFNQDFQDFIEALNEYDVEYMVVGGYAVILHGYIRSTSDLDIWVNKTASNYYNLSRAYNKFGSPIFSKEEFLGHQFDVWSIGVPPNCIEILSEVKGVEFSEAYPVCQSFVQNNVEIKFIHLNQLIEAKRASARHKDNEDIAQLKRK